MDNHFIGINNKQGNMNQGAIIKTPQKKRPFSKCDLYPHEKKGMKGKRLKKTIGKGLLLKDNRQDEG